MIEVTCEHCRCAGALACSAAEGQRREDAKQRLYASVGRNG
jgi:hypothetical protein